MKHLYFWLFLLYCAFPILGNEAPSSKPFAIITVPKSGTHLIEKLFDLIQDRTRFGSTMVDRKSERETQASIDQYFKKGFFLVHVDKAHLVFNSLKRHPDVPIILQVRDLRDSLISLVFHVSKEHRREFGSKTTQQVLKSLLQGNFRKNHYLLDFENHWNLAVDIAQRPGIKISRFEELIGRQGGGEENKQFELIHTLGATVGVELDTFSIEQAVSNLFGNTDTFRQGQIGSWKKYFSAEDLALFNKKFGHLQLALGYTLE